MCLEGFSVTACFGCRMYSFFSNLIGAGLSNLQKLVEVEIIGERSMKEKEKKGNSESKRKMGNLSDVLEREKCRQIEMTINGLSNKTEKRGKSGLVEEVEGERSRIGCTKLRSEVTDEPEELTLAELKLEALRKKIKKKREVHNREERAAVEEGKRQIMCFKNRDVEVMTVEDSDFYDFDEDRVEKSFKKGQVWAIYDDDDGMPRHYGLINDVSLNPFEVKMSWLDVRNDGDERLTSWEKMGFHISCGQFEVARNDTTDLLNIFSHVVDCERAAKKLYRIYPRKGSIWALYNEKALDEEGWTSLSKDKRCYDIVVLLTSYSEMYGLSLAYLEKVDGFKAVFKRREVGSHAIRWLDKGDFRLFSHQIPARKLSGEEAPHLAGDCWELDPASLPSDLLSFS